MAAKHTTLTSSGRELYHCQFSLQTASPETFEYTREFGGGGALLQRSAALGSAKG